MEIIAIPIFDNRISNRLDCCENILLVSIENGEVTNREAFHWAQANPLEKINSLVHLGVEVIICDGLTEFYSNKLKDSPIEVVPWIHGQVEEVLARYLRGELSAEAVTH